MGLASQICYPNFQCPRRTLERRFSKELNQSPLDLIRRVRINHVKTLLQETDLKIGFHFRDGGLQLYRLYGGLLQT